MSEPLRVIEHPVNPRVYVIELSDGTQKLATRNLVPGQRVYGEKLYKIKGTEYREWIPYRSKLAGAILKELKNVPLKEGDTVLYLGAATGTTPSHVSDIIGEKGRLYGVEFSPRVMREFLLIAKTRKNIIPILGDARKPQEYSHIVESVDVIYADVAQPEQSFLIIDNARWFLKKNGHLFFAIKARSIDVTKEPTEIYKREIDRLKEGGFKILEVVHLEPYDRDHAMVVAEYEI